MDLDGAGAAPQRQPQNNLPVINDTPKLDLEPYINNYSGRTRFRRLYFVGECCPPLRLEALRAAVNEAKQGNDLINYKNALSLLQRSSRGGPDGMVDQAWVEQKAKKSKAETLRMEHELKGYKNNLIKESIRMANEELGNHYRGIGDLDNAQKAYGRMRDFCQTPAHIASTAFHMIQVAVEQGNWLAVQSQVHKIRNLQMKPDEAARSQPKIQAAMGLYQMCTGDYLNAAVSFLATEPSLGDTYNEILSANDVAIYGGLCALASMNRHELQSKVLESSTFRSFLELEPHIRRAISFFCASKYSQCLDILENYRSDYLLDIYLFQHVPNIYRRIRTKSIVQYFEPFSRVTLDAMAQTFGTNASPEVTTITNGATSHPPNIDDELISLIEKGVLNAKIDLEARVLVSKDTDLRADVHAEAHAMAKAFIRETRLRMLRMNAVSAGLEIKPPSKVGKGHMLSSKDDDMEQQDFPALTDSTKRTSGQKGVVVRSFSGSSTGNVCGRRHNVLHEVTRRSLTNGTYPDDTIA